MTMRRWRSAVEDLAFRAAWWGWDKLEGAGRITAGRPGARRFRAFGEGSAVCFPVAALVGEDRIEIGTGTVIGPYATLCAGLPGQPPRTWSEPAKLTIGDRSWLGRGLTVTAHHEIHIGDDVWTGHHVFLSDQNHGWEDPDLPIGHQLAPPRPVRIGDGSWIGHGAILLPGALVGRRCVVGAGAVVTGPIPDRSIAVGVPARVVRTIEPGEDLHALGGSVA